MAPALPDMAPLWWPSLLLLLPLYEGAVSFLVDWVESLDFLLLIAFQWSITCASHRPNNWVVASVDHRRLGTVAGPGDCLTLVPIVVLSALVQL